MALDLRGIEKAAKEQGWRMTRTSKGHLGFYPPDRTKRPCISSGTPSDVRAIRNLLACLKRSGLMWPWPTGGTP